MVAYDFGVKYNCLRLLADRGCKVTVVPAKTTVDDVLKLKPDGVFLSNGPGDPAACDYAINHVKQLLEINMPLFGICLGFQLLALASGAKTLKMKFGHHGANHPVQDSQTKRVFITSQNHGFAVDETTLSDNLSITLEDIEANPDFNWNWKKISRRSDLTPKFILDHPDKKWDRLELSRNEFKQSSAMIKSAGKR